MKNGWKLAKFCLELEWKFVVFNENFLVPSLSVLTKYRFILFNLRKNLLPLHKYCNCLAVVQFTLYIINEQNYWPVSFTFNMIFSCHSSAPISVNFETIYLIPARTETSENFRRDKLGSSDKALTFRYRRLCCVVTAIVFATEKFIIIKTFLFKDHKSSALSIKLSPLTELKTLV